MTADKALSARKRPRRDDVRTDIITAAEEEFLRRGYAGANLSNIVEHAGYTKGALYSNFESKSELFVAVVQERFSRVLNHNFAGIVAPFDSELDPTQRISMLAGRLSDLTVADEAWHALVVELAILATRDEAAAALYLRSREIVRRRVEEMVADFFGDAALSDGTSRTELVSSLVILLVNIIALDGSIDRDRFTPTLRTQMFEAALRGAASL